jgi:sugar transferase EpsL
MIAKRLLDLALSVLALLIISPFMVIVGVAVKQTIGSPVLFRQRRPGLHGKPFTIYKFRTMADTRDQHGQRLPDDQRLTRLGKFLRRTSLDEIPELFNVVKGDMSLVGPRPLLMKYVDRYTSEQARRHEVKPGITGWAQVNGRNAITWEQKFEYDVWYVDHVSLRLDLKIIAMTLWKILKMEGINQPGHATAQEFMGTHAKAPQWNPPSEVRQAEFHRAGKDAN